MKVWKSSACGCHYSAIDQIAERLLGSTLSDYSHPRNKRWQLFNHAPYPYGMVQAAMRIFPYSADTSDGIQGVQYIITFTEI